MTIAYTDDTALFEFFRNELGIDDDEHLRDECERDAELDTIVWENTGDEPQDEGEADADLDFDGTVIAGNCADCGYEVRETDAVKVRGRIFHERCAEALWPSSQGDR